MSEKRFTLAYEKGNWWAVRDGDITLWKEEVIHLLNELNDEKERWKSMSVATSNENEILWNEVHILMEQGAEPSDAFKKYLESISTEHTKFWQRKLEKAKKDGVIE